MPDLNQVLSWLLGRIGLRTVALEVIQECNQDCTFCYNVWKCGDYPHGQMDTQRMVDLIDRILHSYRPHVISFTGGEPLLRDDLARLVSHASTRAMCNLITNGTLLNDERVVQLKRAGIRNFEFTLLSAERDIHNAMVRRDSFDRLIEAIASAKAAGAIVTTTFVATRMNIDTWPQALELNVALGVDGILLNRFNVGGAGVNDADDLMPTLEQLELCLAVADEGAKRYGIGISSAIPIPSCVMDTSRFRNLHFSNCAAGTRRAYPVVDPLGNVRPCNHSATILGSVFQTDLRTILQSSPAKGYASTTPEACSGCEHVGACRGGCRAAAEACGDPEAVDPFVTLRRCDQSRGSLCGQGAER